MKNKYFKQVNMQKKLRLFCFPYAGGNTSTYASWQDDLKDICVVPVNMKGRALRIFEDPLSDMFTLVDELYKEIEPFLDAPFAFYGHSLGGLVAFSLLKKIEQEKSVFAQTLILGACRPPHLRDRLKDFTDKTLINKLKAHANTPQEILESQEMMDLILPMIRADYKLVNSCEVEETKILRSKVLLLNCEEDIEREMYLEWEKYFKNKCEYKNLEGGHFFVQEERESLLKVLKEVLA